MRLRSEISAIRVNKKSNKEIAIETIHMLRNTLLEIFLSIMSPNIVINFFCSRASYNLTKLPILEKGSAETLDK